MDSAHCYQHQQCHCRQDMLDLLSTYIRSGVIFTKSYVTTISMSAGFWPMNTKEVINKMR
jgi:hypothetical protein